MESLAWLLVLALFFPSLRIGYAELLMHSPKNVVCSGPCCIKGANRSMINVEHGCPVDYEAEYAIDNNFNTSWNLSTIYSYEVLAGLTLDLGQMTQGIQTIEVYGTLSVPELSVSTNGINFDIVETVSYSNNFGKLRIEPVLQPLEVRQAQYVHLQFSDVEITDNIAEIFIILAADNGCGFCISQLTKKLTNFTDQLITAFQLFGDHIRIEMFCVQLQRFLGSVGDLETVTPRLRTTLEENASLQMTVKRNHTCTRIEHLMFTTPYPLSTLLLPATVQLNLATLALCDNVDDLYCTKALEFDASHIHRELLNYSSGVQDQHRISTGYWEDTSELKKGVLLMLKRLTFQLNETIMSASKARGISVSLSAQNYTTIKRETLMYKDVAERKNTVSNAISVAVEVFSNKVGLVLERSTIRSFELITVSMQAITLSFVNNSAPADAALMEIDDLMQNVDVMVLVYSNMEADCAFMLRTGQTLLNETSLILIESSLNLLLQLTSTLDGDVENYKVGINLCRSAVCTLGLTYAELLFQNASIILINSVSTYQRSKMFVNTTLNLTRLFTSIYLSRFTVNVQSIVTATDNQLRSAVVTFLSTEAPLMQENFFILNNQSLQLLLQIFGFQSMLQLLKEKHSGLIALLDDSNFLSANYSGIMEELSNQASLPQEVDHVQLDAEKARNSTIFSNVLVSSIDHQTVESVLYNTSVITRNASLALDTLQINFERNELFINVTRRAVDRFFVDVGEFILENNRILGEIDRIITSLGGIHTRINTINSPKLFSAMDEYSSYVSLQPPPERMASDKVQFESLDLYMWTGPEFRTPTVLFYFGPICSVGNTGSYDSEDYFAAFLENDGVIGVHWKVGNDTGTTSHDGFQLGFSQLHVTRLGASFDIRYGVSIGELGNLFTFGAVSNDSILFTISNKTAFFLGGLPQGSQQECGAPVIQSNTYAPFEGQIQQLLYNGKQWGLWNIRSSSDTTFHGEFRRNELATANAWHASQSSTASAISFDGMGHLFVEQFSSISSGFSMMTITLWPNDESDGLVLYAYDSMINLSMEIYFQAGKLKLLVVRHDTNVTLVNYVQKLDSSIIAQTIRTLVIRFREGDGFQVNGMNFKSGQKAVFFTDLTHVKAWFGGINENLLDNDSVFKPAGTLAGYHGCVDIAIEDDVVSSNVFEGDHFTDQYLNSFVQQGFSATCLQTVYASEVGFDGTSEAFLAYSYLDTVIPPNSPLDFDQTSESKMTVMSLSFYPERAEGIMLVLHNENEDEMAVVMQDSFLEIRIKLTSGETSILSSKELVTTNEWHHVLIQIRADMYEFYLDGLVQTSSPILSMFKLQRISRPPENSEPRPVIFVGGTDGVVTSVNGSLPFFTGCMKDLSYGYKAVSFLNSAQTLARYPPGVTYHSCPFISSTAFQPALSVHPNQPKPNMCVTSPSVISASHGSFHRETQLNTSNIIGLFRRSWSLEISLQYMDDGHILSIMGAKKDYMISLIIQNRTPSLLLKGDTLQQVSGERLNGSDSVELGISCSTNSTSISCFLSVDNSQSEVGVIDASEFVPDPPIILGQAYLHEAGKVDSFVGCIHSISTNKDVSGFEDLHTGLLCHDSTDKGIVFIGTSLLERRVSFGENESLTISLTFRAAQANGLIMVLTIADVIFAVELRNGRVRVSNLQGIHEEIPIDVCDLNNHTFSTLEVILQNEMTVVLNNLTATLPVAIRSGLVTISIGGAPENFTIKDLWLNESEESKGANLLPGLVGCASEVKINENNHTFDVTKNILTGSCLL